MSADPILEIRERAWRLIRETEADEQWITALTKIMEPYPLSEREKDFAFHFMVGPQKTIHYWSFQYNVAESTIYHWLENPEMQKLIKDLRYNIHRYVAHAQTFLIRDALDQYRRIFEFPETESSLTSKRMAAKDVLMFTLLSSKEVAAATTDGKSLFAQFRDDGENAAIPAEFTTEQIAEQLEDLKALRTITQQGREFSDNGRKK